MCSLAFNIHKHRDCILTVPTFEKSQLDLTKYSLIGSKAEFTYYTDKNPEGWCSKAGRVMSIWLLTVVFLGLPYLIAIIIGAGDRYINQLCPTRLYKIQSQNLQNQSGSIDPSARPGIFLALQPGISSSAVTPIPPQASTTHPIIPVLPNGPNQLIPSSNSTMTTTAVLSQTSTPVTNSSRSLSSSNSVKMSSDLAPVSTTGGQNSSSSTITTLTQATMPISSSSSLTSVVFSKVLPEEPSMSGQRLLYSEDPKHQQILEKVLGVNWRSSNWRPFVHVEKDSDAEHVYASVTDLQEFTLRLPERELLKQLSQRTNRGDGRTFQIIAMRWLTIDPYLELVQQFHKGNPLPELCIYAKASTERLQWSEMGETLERFKNPLLLLIEPTTNPTTRAKGTRLDRDLPNVKGMLFDRDKRILHPKSTWQKTQNEAVAGYLYNHLCKLFAL